LRETNKEYYILKDSSLLEVNSLKGQRREPGRGKTLFSLVEGRISYLTGGALES